MNQMDDRITPAQYYTLPAAKHAAGRNAIRTEDGFDSRAERKWWGILCQMQAAGMISGLRRQVKIPLHGRDGPILTPTGRQMVYRADFVYTEAGQEVIADCKGYSAPVYEMKKAILAAQGVKIRELKG